MSTGYGSTPPNDPNQPGGGQPYGSPDQPPAGYGQPPQYGQQPPAYGQPAYGDPSYGQPAHGQPAYGQPGPGSSAYASWGSRVGSSVIDSLVAAAPAIVIAIIATVIGGDDGPNGALLALAYLVSIGVTVWNSGIKQGTTGQSIGKGVMNTRLLRESDGQPLGAGMSILRQLAHILNAIPCYVGFLWPLWDAKKQTFADKVCSSVVVRAG